MNFKRVSRQVCGEYAAKFSRKGWLKNKWSYLLHSKYVKIKRISVGKDYEEWLAYSK